MPSSSSDSVTIALSSTSPLREREALLPRDVIRVKHKYRVGEACWTNWNGRYVLVLVHRLHQRLAIMKKKPPEDINEKRRKPRNRGTKQKSSRQLSSNSRKSGVNNATVMVQKSKSSSGKSKSSTSSRKSSNWSTSGEDEVEEKGKKRKGGGGVAGVGEKEKDEEEEEAENAEEEDELRHIPIYFISYVGWGQQYFEWRNEEYLLPSDSLTSAECHAHNQKMFEDTRGLKGEAEEDVIARFIKKQECQRKEQMHSMMKDGKCRRRGGSGGGGGGGGKEDESNETNNDNGSETKEVSLKKSQQCFTFPPRMEVFLEKDAQQIQRKKLIALPKAADLTLSCLMDNFRKGCLNLSSSSETESTVTNDSNNSSTCLRKNRRGGGGGGGKDERIMVDVSSSSSDCHSSSNSSDGYGIEEEEEGEYNNSRELRRMLRWLDILVRAFDLHFLGRGLYDSEVEIKQMRKLVEIHQKGKRRLSELVGVEHFLRFLSFRVFGNHFLQKIIFEVPEMSREMENAVHLFLMFVDERWDAIVGEHVQFE